MRCRGLRTARAETRLATGEDFLWNIRLEHRTLALNPCQVGIMSNNFHGRGNLGAAPTLRHAEHGGESTPVANLRIFFDRPKPDGNGGFEDKGGFWMDVALWGARAETAARLLPKGARVRVEGELFESTWADRETGEERSRLEVRAVSVDLDLSRVDEVTFRRRSEGEAERGA